MSNRKKKPFDQLTITDNYMFQAVMKEPKYVKPLLEMVIGKKIRKVVVADREKTLETGYDARGIRMDVYVEDDENTVYDVEMLAYMDGKAPETEYSRMLDEAVKKVKHNEARRTEYMNINTFAIDEREMGEYMKIVSQIRINDKRLSDSDIVSILNIKPVVLYCVRKALSEHPDWDDEDIAEEVLAMDELDEADD